MNILFLHGWQSTPGGRKPTYLKDHGHAVLNPALPDDDFDAAVRIAQAEFDQHQPDVVVGSSRGGAVAMNIESGDTPLVLLCPAWKRWGTATTVKPNTVILHSEQDDVMPFADSQELLRNSGLPESTLVDVGTDHRLADPESLETMLEAVEKVGVKAGRLAGHVVPHEAGVPQPLRRRYAPGHQHDVCHAVRRLAARRGLAQVPRMGHHLLFRYWARADASVQGTATDEGRR